MGRVNNSNGEYPADLDIFVDKKMLFEVEITDGKLKHGWRTMLKRVSDDVDLIKRFVTLHNIKVGTEEDIDEDTHDNMLNLSDEAPMEQRLIEGGG